MSGRTSRGDRCALTMVPSIPGPSFVVDEESGKLAGVDWQFNAWGGLDGGCYNDWALDSLVARKICQIERVER